ncbi:Transcription factor mbp1 [Coemansia biformis]|uniref:Transcription factor mbp1 n=1 Tax=Coemansia biformis TaxID=1286918 RepID=A0A9W7YEU5_9FUNG|nr:Transcription factor mbp1 [Coemansia biformis]
MAGPSGASAAARSASLLDAGSPVDENENLVWSASYAGVEVLQKLHNGTAVMLRRKDSYVNVTQILKCADYDKASRTRFLEREIHTGVHEKIQGGYGKYQGTWVPLECAANLARRLGLYGALRNLFEYNPAPGEKPPTAPRSLESMNKRKRANAGHDLASPSTRRRTGSDRPRPGSLNTILNTASPETDHPQHFALRELRASPPRRRQPAPADGWHAGAGARTPAHRHHDHHPHPHHDGRFAMHATPETPGGGRGAEPDHGWALRDISNTYHSMHSSTSKQRVAKPPASLFTPPLLPPPSSAAAGLQQPYPCTPLTSAQHQRASLITPPYTRPPAPHKHISSSRPPWSPSAQPGPAAFDAGSPPDHLQSAPPLLLLGPDAEQPEHNAGGSATADAGAGAGPLHGLLDFGADPRWGQPASAERNTPQVSSSSTTSSLSASTAAMSAAVAAAVEEVRGGEGDRYSTFASRATAAIQQAAADVRLEHRARKIALDEDTRYAAGLLLELRTERDTAQAEVSGYEAVASECCTAGAREAALQRRVECTVNLQQTARATAAAMSAACRDQPADGAASPAADADALRAEYRGLQRRAAAYEHESRLLAGEYAQLAAVVKPWPRQSALSLAGLLGASADALHGDDPIAVLSELLGTVRHPQLRTVDADADDVRAVNAALDADEERVHKLERVVAAACGDVPLDRVRTAVGPVLSVLNHGSTL